MPSALRREHSRVACVASVAGARPATQANSRVEEKSKRAGKNSSRKSKDEN